MSSRQLGSEMPGTHPAGAATRDRAVSVGGSIPGAGFGDRGAILLLAACFFGVAAWLDAFVIPFPTDNDLDEIGWLVRHLSLERPESLANANYPMGLPLLLALLTPAFGDLLRVSLLLSAAACAATLVLCCRIAGELGGDRNARIATAVLVACVAFRSATSEFADSTATLCFVGSLCLLLGHGRRTTSALAAGALIGIAFGFRYHFLAVALVVAAACTLLRSSGPDRLRLATCVVAGFTAGALPVFAANVAAGGNPLATGITPYLVGQHATRSVDWEDYVGTYDLWPVSRLVTENLPALVARLASTTAAVLTRPITIGALIFGGLYLWRRRGSTGDARVRFLAICTVAYLALIPIPTQVTNRAMLPGEVLVVVLVVWIVTRSIEDVAPRRGAAWAIAAALGLVAVVATLQNVSHVRWKRDALQENRAWLDVLRTAGMHGSAEVFTNEWHFYPLDDPEFVTFYNYGGWIQLDPEYARQRPAPDALTPAQWHEFATGRGIRFLVLRRTPKTQSLFAGSPDGPRFASLHASGEHRIFAVLRPEPSRRTASRPEAADRPQR